MFLMTWEKSQMLLWWLNVLVDLGKGPDVAVVRDPGATVVTQHENPFYFQINKLITWPRNTLFLKGKFYSLQKRNFGGYDPQKFCFLFKENKKGQLSLWNTFYFKIKRNLIYVHNLMIICDLLVWLWFGTWNVSYVIDCSFRHNESCPESWWVMVLELGGIAFGVQC